MKNRSTMGFEVRVLFHERVAIEPVLHRFQKEVLQPRGLRVAGTLLSEWTGFITRDAGRSIQETDRHAVFRWLKAQAEVAKCTVELPARVSIREVRQLIWSLV